MAVSSGVMEILGGQDFHISFSVWRETVPVIFIDYILINSSRDSSVHPLISFVQFGKFQILLGTGSTELMHFLDVLTYALGEGSRSALKENH